MYIIWNNRIFKAKKNRRTKKLTKYYMELKERKIIRKISNLRIGKLTNFKSIWKINISILDIWI